MTPNQVFGTDVHGNFISDHPLWDQCDDIIIDPTQPLEVRLNALRKIDEICGESGDINEAALEEHAQQVRDARGIS